MRRRTSRSGRWPRLPRGAAGADRQTSRSDGVRTSEDLAWTQAQISFTIWNWSGEAHLFQRLANRILYSDPTLRPSRDVLRGAGSASTLWANGISGDLPIVLIRIDDEDLRTRAPNAARL